MFIFYFLSQGEAIAWIFGLVLSETVQMVENDLRTKSKDNLLTGNIIMLG